MAKRYARSKPQRKRKRKTARIVYDGMVKKMVNSSADMSYNLATAEAFVDVHWHSPAPNNGWAARVAGNTYFNINDEYVVHSTYHSHYKINGIKIRWTPHIPQNRVNGEAYLTGCKASNTSVTPWGVGVGEQNLQQAIDYK